MQSAKERIGWVRLPLLWQWRAAYSLSQEELARRAGVSRATVISAEKGQRITFKVAESLAHVFGTTRQILAEQLPNEKHEEGGRLVHA